MSSLAARLDHVFRATEEENRRTILAVVPRMPGGTLLDLGCGEGSFTTRVAQRMDAGSMLGVEFIPEVAAVARARGIDVREADLGQRLPYDDASVDVVHSNQVIEHLPKTDVFLREIRRVLKPGGAAVISTNNLASWHNVAALVAGWQPTPCHVSDEVIVGNPANIQDGAPGSLGQCHLRVFTGRALAELAVAHGFVVDRDLTAGYYPLAPRLARVATRVDRRHGAFLVQRLRVLA